MVAVMVVVVAVALFANCLRCGIVGAKPNLIRAHPDAIAIAIDSHYIHVLWL